MDVSSALILVVAAIVGGGLVLYNMRHRRPGPDGPVRPSPQDKTHLYELATRAVAYYQASASPEDLLVHEPFLDGVGHLQGEAYSDGDLLGYFTGDNAVVACMALEALARRPGREDVIERILAGFNEVAPWTRFFALRVLDARVEAGQPLLGRVLTRVDESWNFPVCVHLLRDFVQRRVAGGEKPVFGDTLEALTDGTAAAGGTAPPDGAGGGPGSPSQWLAGLLPRLGDSLQPMIEELRRWNAGRVDEDALRTIGSVWESADTVAEPVPHPALERRVAQIESELLREPPRSVLLVGEPGTGKTAAIHALGRRMKQKGFSIFEAGHAELLAGMTYMGQLEERQRRLVELIGGGRPVLWIVPQFHALSWAGRHQFEQSSVLDYLLPRIERGEIRLIGETTPSGYQRLIRSKPRCRTALHASTFEPLPAAETLQLARDWIARNTPPGAAPFAGEDTLREAWSLALQFMGTRAAPGNLLDLLSITVRRLRGGEANQAVEIGVDDLIATLGSVTGLPASILDDRATLDLSKLRELFESRVMGQPEAVDCLVERVAMIKAGVTDPTRPQGVFLLAGPTGTGKTEIGKALAEFLFGSPDRMIRMDMSEFQDEASLGRILGETDDRTPGDSLIDQIRKEPFSLVLLDEFEKANRRIWDLFLQVFDDGRLTDRLGRTGDFRHALILMTSNLGASIPAGLGLGFLDRSGTFSPGAVLREVGKVFRKEFLNRIDRVIVFRPLERETMRAILRRELNEVFDRRGLRNRQWAVEWDEAALDFLLEKGFTADMGARPLKRSIERHLLAPLAQTIVDHRFPEGDQFLFVTSTGSELRVRFVDPDAPVETDEQPPATPPSFGPPAGTARLQDLVLSPRGEVAELGFLRSAFDGLAGRASEQDLQGAKRTALQAVAAPGFWESAGRFAVLGRAEYLDRIESGLDSARSLLQRLEQMAERHTTPPPRDLVGRLGQQLWLLGHALDDVSAGRPTEAWLSVDAGYETGATALRSNPFAHRLDGMYRGWARRRGMRLDVLEEATRGGAPYRAILAVSGYAAFALLEPEDGVHVWQEPAETKRAPARRCAVRVRVVPQPETPVDDPLAHARREFGRPEGASPAIVRRYQEIPTPLVRDLRRGWRTGLLERVLAGNFDLI